MKNIRNNLLSPRKSVIFFYFEVYGMNLSSSPAYVSWQDDHKVHDKEQKLQANLNKATKLSYKALYSANNKQHVNLALPIFHETTIAACKSYFPEKKDISSFLNLILTWWTISNNNIKCNSNLLGSTITCNVNEMELFEIFATGWKH